MTGLSEEMLLAAGVLAAAYALIFSERIHRTIASLVGAVVMVGVGEYTGFYTQEEALAAVDGNTMLLLLGMMLLVALLRPTGGFEYLAIRVAKLAGNENLVDAFEKIPYGLWPLVREVEGYALEPIQKSDERTFKIRPSGIISVPREEVSRQHIRHTGVGKNHPRFNCLHALSQWY